MYSLNPAGFHWRTEQMLDIRKNSIYDVYCISLYLYQCYSSNLFWGGLDSAVGRGDSAVLGGVEVVGSIPAVGHKIFFSIFQHS